MKIVIEYFEVSRIGHNYSKKYQIFSYNCTVATIKIMFIKKLIIFLFFSFSLVCSAPHHWCTVVRASAVGGTIAGSVTGAAGAGALIGTFILPGMGTALGALLGGITGGAAGTSILHPISNATYDTCMSLLT